MNNTIKKLLLILAMFLTFLSIISVVQAAPTTQFFVNLAPFTDATYYNGSTSLAWLNTFTKGLTLSTTTAGCLATSPTGIVFAGSPCGTGSGTVSAGTQGQFPFYNSNGTTLTATSTFNITQSGQLLINGITNVGVGANLTVYGRHTYSDQSGIIEGCDTLNIDQCIYMGYDHNANFAYIQSIDKTNNFNPLIINPNGGFVSIGGISLPNAILQVDRFGPAPIDVSTNPTLWPGGNDDTIGSYISSIGLGYHSGTVTKATIALGAQTVESNGGPHAFSEDFTISLRKYLQFYDTPLVEGLRISDAGILMIGSSTMAYGSFTKSAQVLFASSTAPQLSLEASTNSSLHTFRALDDGSLVFATSSPLTGATSTPYFVINSNGQLGIGTTTPSQQLDVNGNISIENANGILMKDTNDSNCYLVTLVSGTLTTTSHACN